MKNKTNIYHIGGASIFYGILVFLFIYTKDYNQLESLLLASIFTIVLFTVLVILHIKTIQKLNIFNRLTYIMLQSFLYGLAITFSFLTTFSLYSLFSISMDDLKNFLVEGLLRGFLYIVTLPFSEETFAINYSPEMQSITFTFFVIIFIIGIVSVISAYIEIRWREVKQKQLITDAELKALQAQIEPHFLFNSLNAIVSIVKSDPAKAEDLLIKLSDLLHHIFSATNRIKSTLREEINFTKNYLILMQERFSNNLKVSWYENIEKDDIMVPSLVCQPLIENAIKHGWLEKSNKFELNISINTNEKAIECKFQDNGIGIHHQKLKSLPQKGHALYNLTERLYLEYQEKDLLQIKSELGNGTTIHLKIPVRQ